MLIFSGFNVIVSNPVIFLPIFNFMQITHHNIMVWDLELHTIAIKRCFGMLQPRMRYLMLGLLLTGTKQKIEDSSYINNGVFI